MNEKHQKIVDILDSYNLLFDMPQDFDKISDLHTLFHNTLQNYELFRFDPTIQGGSGEKLDEFSCFFLDTIQEAVAEEFGITNLKSSTRTVDDGFERANISFTLDDDTHSWTFDEDEIQYFYEDVLDLVANEVDGYFDQRGEIIIAWRIDPYALEELKNVFEPPKSKEELKARAKEQNRISLIGITATTDSGISEELLRRLSEARAHLNNECLPHYFDGIGKSCLSLLNGLFYERPDWIHSKLEIYEHLVPVYVKPEGNTVLVTYPVSSSRHATTMYAFLQNFYTRLGLTVSDEWQTMDISMIEFQTYTER